MFSRINGMLAAPERVYSTASTANDLGGQNHDPSEPSKQALVPPQNFSAQETQAASEMQLPLLPLEFLIRRSIKNSLGASILELLALLQRQAPLLKNGGQNAYRRILRVQQKSRLRKGAILNQTI